MLIALTVLVLTGTTVAVSLLLPKTYQATATIVLDRSSDPLLGDVQTQRRLTTAQALLKTEDVLAAAARRVEGESADSLRDKVVSSLEPETDIIRVSVTERRPQLAADAANAVAAAFLAKQSRLARTRVERTRAQLLQQLAALRRTRADDPQVEALRQELSTLAINQATAGSELQVAEAATPPKSPHSPHPMRNGVLALFASLFLGVLIAIGRDVTRVSGPREVSRLTGLPQLARVPASGRSPLRRGPRKFNLAEREAFDTLERMVTIALPPRRQHVILVTSAVPGEGRTRVVAGLGRALARNGREVLLLSADLRRPKLHQYFDLVGDFGLVDVLGANLENGRRPSAGDIVPALLGPLPQASGNLMLLPSGKPASDPARLFSDDLLEPFFETIGRMDYEYVVIDAPPLLGRVDTYALARWSTAILVIARPDRLRADNAAELRELLDRLETDPLGLVVIGR